MKKVTFDRIQEIFFNLIKFAVLSLVFTLIIFVFVVSFIQFIQYIQNLL